MHFFRTTSILLVSLAAASARAQVTSVRGVTPESAGPSATSLKAAQLEFEGFRRDHLPTMNVGRGGGSGKCDEQVGRFCYWYDEKTAGPPREPEQLGRGRSMIRGANLGMAFLLELAVLFAVGYWGFRLSVGLPL